MSKTIIQEGVHNGVKIVAKWRTERGHRMAGIFKCEKLETGKFREKQLVQVMTNKFQSEDDCTVFVGQLMEDLCSPSVSRGSWALGFACVLVWTRTQACLKGVFAGCRD